LAVEPANEFRALGAYCEQRAPDVRFHEPRIALNCCYHAQHDWQRPRWAVRTVIGSAYVELAFERAHHVAIEVPACVGERRSEVL
jgi:hypothetical protein